MFAKFSLSTLLAFDDHTKWAILLYMSESRRPTFSAQEMRLKNCHKKLNICHIFNFCVRLMIYTALFMYQVMLPSSSVQRMSKIFIKETSHEWGIIKARYLQSYLLPEKMYQFKFWLYRLSHEKAILVWSTFALRKKL